MSKWICAISNQEITVVAVETHPIKTLHPAEEIYIARAAPGRRAEFSAGRFCGHQAVARLGLPDQPIIVGDKGEPIWPKEVVGSITHDQGIAVAVVAPVKTVFAIGIDLLALNHSLDSSVASLVGSQPEFDIIGNMITRSESNLGIGNNYVDPLLLAFSAKESAIKAVSPLIDNYLDFGDIKLNCDGNLIQAQLASLNKYMQIHWHIFNRMIFTFTIEQQKVAQ